MRENFLQFFKLSTHNESKVTFIKSLFLTFPYYWIIGLIIMHNNNKLKIVTQVFASFSLQVLQNLFVALCTCWCYDQRRQSIPRVERDSLKVKYYTVQYMLPSTPTMSQVAGRWARSQSLPLQQFIKYSSFQLYLIAYHFQFSISPYKMSQICFL